jgi:hypothetical protein
MAMKTVAPVVLRRPLSLAVAGVLLAVLAACTGRGGGQLPADNVLFTGAASFGFSFSCEQGDLRIQLDYTDKGGNPLGSSFAIHGIVDRVDPVLESAVCIGENPPPPPENQLIFLGRYYLMSSAPAGFPSSCPPSGSAANSLCRFEVIVQDNDRSLAPSPGDFFSVKLSTVTASCDASTLEALDPTCSQLPGATVFYARAGSLNSGNITVV